MKLVVSIEDVFVKDHANRPTGSNNFSNFYGYSSLTRWIENGLLYVVVDEENTLLLRQDRDFFHIYAVCGSQDRLVQLIDGLDSSHTYVIDLIEGSRPIADLIGSLTTIGFQPYRVLQRMERPPCTIMNSARHAVRLARSDDVSWILDCLEENFDRFSEQLPYRFEIVSAVKDSLISVSETDGHRAGFLYSEHTRMRTLLRYWFVSAEARSLGVGGSLMRNYLSRFCTTRRSQLWVVQQNESAITRYHHYGYSFGSLVNTVLVRKG